MTHKLSMMGLSVLAIAFGIRHYFVDKPLEVNYSDYELLAMIDEGEFASRTFLKTPRIPDFDEGTAKSGKDPLEKIDEESVQHLLAPAINARAIGKFLNNSLPTTTPIGNTGVPALLSQTGAFANLTTLEPSPGLIPYDVIEPFWSDGATKKRWMAIPNDGAHNTPAEKITFSRDNAWDFPAGAVLIKHFEFPGNRLETRFEVKGNDNVYYYLTYKWNASQTDAVLLNEAIDEDIVVNGVTQSWHYPSRNECASCHFPQNGSVLGPKTRNLNKTLVYPSSGIAMNQLVNLSELGILTENINNTNASSYPAIFAKNDINASLEDRARSYLDVNCASCHNPQVDNVAMFDARYTTPLENQNIINGDVIYDEGLIDPKVIVPQDVSNSVAHFRMNSTQTGIEMPPLAKDVVDTEGVRLIADWINSISPTSTNGPVAAFSASTTYGTAPLSVSFDASDSTDPNGNPLSYSWTFGDGSTGQGANINHVYQNPGSYAARLTVNNGQASDQETLTIVANDANPGTNTVAFTDGTGLIGQNNYSGLPMGVIDMNGDGKDDIVQFNSAQNLRIQYQNAPGQVFSSYSFGQVSTRNQWSTAIADIDQNGYNDIIAGGSYDNIKLIKNNNGTNSFSMSTLQNSNIFIQGSNFVDINNDGWADIFACHDDAESRAYQNNQNGSFTFNSNLISTETTPISDNSGNYASMWVDYDNDRDLDLYISKCRGGVTSSSDPRRINMLWQNDGNNNFTEVAAQANLKIGDQTWLTDFGDIDNDGDLDAIVINHGTGPNLMRNNGNGTFTEVTAGSGLLPTLSPQDFYGIQGFFRDFNNDGYLDLMVSGDHHYLFYNNGDGTFQNAPNPFNSNQIQSFSVGDLNHDGFLDIYAGYASGLNSPTTTRDRIWLNQGNANNFLNIQLKGTQSNINGIGARVELYGAWGMQIRDVRSGEGYGLVNSFTQHFGIGVNTQVDRVVVRWPSGIVDEIVNPEINQFLQITESLPGPTCNDGIQNGDETGVDCGGSCANPCPCEGPVSVSIDFENGSGNNWTLSGTAQAGAFVIGSPTAQSSSGIQTQPEGDHSPIGSNAFFTAPNSSVGVDDVDGGVTRATSPIYPITEDSKLSIWYFFGQRDAGRDPGDYFLLDYSLDGGTSYTPLVYHGDVTVVAEWTEAVANIPGGSNLVIRVAASDGPTLGDIIEAGIDDIKVTSVCENPIAVTGVTVTPNTLTLSEGNSQQLTATVVPANASDTSVNWSSSNTAIATVDTNGVVNAIAQGTAIVTATTTDGGFQAASVITVEGTGVPVTGVSVTPNFTTLVEGNTRQLTATVTPANADDTSVSWTSNNTGVATVDTNGVVTAVGEGNAIIAATTTDGGFIGTSLIIVERATGISVTGVSVAPNAVTLPEGSTRQLTATVVPADADDTTVSWSSNNNGVVTVDTNGVVSAVAAGTAVITVTTTDGNYQASSTVTVTPSTGPIAVYNVTVAPTLVDLNVGETVQLTANVFPTNASDQTVSWFSNNPAIATIDSNTGLVTAVGAGEVDVTVVTNDGGYRASAIINVTGNAPIVDVYNVTVTPTTVALNVGETFQLAANVQPENATDQSVSWFSNNPAIATIDSTTGLVTAVGAGEVDVTVVTNDGGYRASAIITVTGSAPIINVYNVSISPASVNLNVGETFQLAANVQPANATDQGVSWFSNNPNIATIDPLTGRVTAVGAGAVDVTVVTSDGGYRASAIIYVTGTAPIINVYNVSVTPANAQLEVGESLQLGANVQPSNATDTSVTWFSNNPNIATIDPITGLVTAISEGIVDVTVRTTDGGYQASSVISVVPRSSNLRVYPNPTSGQLNVDLSDYMGLDLQIQLYNQSNQLLATYPIDRNHPEVYAIFVTGLPEGYYYLILQSIRGSESHSFLIRY